MTKRFINYLRWVILVISSLYLAAGWLWKFPFIRGNIRGIYWLLIWFDHTTIVLTITTVLVLVALVVVIVVKAVRRQPDIVQWVGTAGVILTASLILVGACIPALMSPSTHLSRVSANQKVYNVSGMTAFFDTNYALYECDKLGLVCQQIDLSPDLPRSDPMRANLIYDASTNSLDVGVEGLGIIFSHSLEQ